VVQIAQHQLRLARSRPSTPANGRLQTSESTARVPLALKRTPQIALAIPGEGPFAWSGWGPPRQRSFALANLGEISKRIVQSWEQLQRRVQRQFHSCSRASGEQSSRGESRHGRSSLGPRSLPPAEQLQAIEVLIQLSRNVSARVRLGRSLSQIEHPLRCILGIRIVNESGLITIKKLLYPEII